METSASSILTHRDGAVLTLTLNRPTRLNALDDDMLVRLHTALAAASADPEVRALLLTGAGRGFCAGQDLRAREGAAAADLGTVLDTRYRPVIDAIVHCPKPVVCAVNGVAAGAGANLPLACDVVYAAKSAQFIQAFAHIGLVPDAGGTWWLPRAIGLPRAKALALLAEPLDAETAARWGLIWRAVDDDRLMAEAGAAAQRLAAGPTAAFALTKRAFRSTQGNDLDAQLDMERDLQRAAGETADHAEGLRAFIEKRVPKFRGE